MSDAAAAATTTPRPLTTRRTRIVCISDTHNCTVRLPKGDVLIHCGDLTNQGGAAELEKQVQWLERADFECKIVVAGNHDLALDAPFYSSQGYLRHGNGAGIHPSIIAEHCEALFTQSKSLTYLRHESRTIRLTGPRTTFTVFGSPYSQQWGGAWAFQYPRYEEDANTTSSGGDWSNSAAAALWDQIPLGTDILITHGPARTHCDVAGRTTKEHAGCEVLRRALWHLRPRLALCGHIHEARGVERVRWNLDSAYTEVGRTPWTDPDPESEKNALVDLGVKGGSPLDNDGVDRRETCVINCAIQSSSYPHSGHGPRRFFKPFVVDLDLPVWEGKDKEISGM